MDFANRNKNFQAIGIGLIINDNGKILIDKRINGDHLGGMWEFPGGKQEEGESIEITIIRELKEELDIEVEVGERVLIVDHSVNNNYLRFVAHICHIIKGDPKPLWSQEIKWVYPEELKNYEFPKINTKIIYALKAYLKDANTI